MGETKEPDHIIAESSFNDVRERVRFQHEFALGGFRALLLINGGAIIALLTYAGNALGAKSAVHLQAAFIWYVFGLSATTAAYVFAYFSQGMFMYYSYNSALERLGVRVSDVETAAIDVGLERRGNIGVAVAVLLVCVALATFLAGSFSAMSALTEALPKGQQIKSAPSRN